MTTVAGERCGRRITADWRVNGPNGRLDDHGRLLSDTYNDRLRPSGQRRDTRGQVFRGWRPALAARFDS